MSWVLQLNDSIREPAPNLPGGDISSIQWDFRDNIRIFLFLNSQLCVVKVPSRWKWAWLIYKLLQDTTSTILIGASTSSEKLYFSRIGILNTYDILMIGMPHCMNNYLYNISWPFSLILSTCTFHGCFFKF